MRFEAFKSSNLQNCELRPMPLSTLSSSLLRPGKRRWGGGRAEVLWTVAIHPIFHPPELPIFPSSSLIFVCKDTKNFENKENFFHQIAIFNMIYDSKSDMLKKPPLRFNNSPSARGTKNLQYTSREASFFKNRGVSATRADMDSSMMRKSKELADM